MEIEIDTLEALSLLSGASGVTGSGQRYELTLEKPDILTNLLVDGLLAKAVKPEELIEAATADYKGGSLTESMLKDVSFWVTMWSAGALKALQKELSEYQLPKAYTNQLSNIHKAFNSLTANKEKILFSEFKLFPFDRWYIVRTNEDREIHIKDSRSDSFFLLQRHDFGTPKLEEQVRFINQIAELIQAIRARTQHEVKYDIVPDHKDTYKTSFVNTLTGKGKPDEAWHLTITDYERGKTDWTPKTEALFDQLKRELVFHNTYGRKPKLKVVKMDLGEYARRCERDISTPEAKRNFRREVRKQLNVIVSSQAITDNGKTIINFVEAVSLKNDFITVSFTGPLSTLLNKEGFLTPLPETAAALAAGWDQNSYPLLKALSFHYFNKHNKAKGTNNCLSVESLLKNLKHIPDKKNTDKGHYRELVRSPFTNALNALQERSFITWEYRKDKDMISKEEADRLHINEWSKLYIIFDFLDAPELEDKEAREAEDSSQKAELPGGENTPLQEQSV